MICYEKLVSEYARERLYAAAQGAYIPSSESVEARSWRVKRSRLLCVNESARAAQERDCMNFLRFCAATSDDRVRSVWSVCRNRHHRIYFRWSSIFFLSLLFCNYLPHMYVFSPCIHVRSYDPVRSSKYTAYKVCACFVGRAIWHNFHGAWSWV